MDSTALLSHLPSLPPPHTKHPYITQLVMDAKKQLRIKSGVVKRLNKEVQMYEKEVVEGELKVQQMKEEGKDPYDIKKMVRL